MPVIKSAKKKLRQDVKRTFKNKKVKVTLKSVVKKTKENVTAESLKLAFQAADRAAKNHVIHKNKAARIKSRLAKLLSKVTGVKETAPVAKIAPKKAAKKTIK